MIRIIYGVPGVGKTAFMVAKAIENMYGDNAINALEHANAEVLFLNENGFNVTAPKSEHLVYCAKPLTIDVTSPDFGHRRSLELDPERLGIAIDGFDAQYVYRGSTICLDELPDIADSRNWGNFPEATCRYWAKHRKHRINAYATCQDIDQVEKRIRRVAMITEIVSMKLVENKYDEVIKTVWEVNNWRSCEAWERGNEPEKETYVYNGDIRLAYDTYEGEEEFYIGLKDTDFSCEYSGYQDFTPEAIENYSKKSAQAKK